MKGVIFGSLIGVIICISLIVACGGATSSTSSSFDKTKMFKDIGESVIIPSYENFAVACDELVAAYEIYKSEKNQTNFDNLKSAWRKAQSAWEEAEGNNFGPAIKNGYIYNIDFSPCRVSLINSTLASKALFEEIDFESIGAAAKGLPTIEYFLFNPSLANDFNFFLITEQEKTFFDSLVRFTASNARKLLNEWLTTDGNFIETFSNPGVTNLNYTTNQKVIDDIVNALIVQIETVRDTKIGKPLGKSTNTTNAQLSESPYSKTSLENIKANLKGIKAHFTYIENRLMLIDFLNTSNPAGSKAINEQLDKINDKLESQTLSLEMLVVNNPDECEELIDLFTKLVQQIKFIFKATGVTLHTSDNDGD